MLSRRPSAYSHRPWNPLGQIFGSDRRGGNFCAEHTFAGPALPERRWVSAYRRWPFLSRAVRAICRRTGPLVIGRAVSLPLLTLRRGGFEGSAGALPVSGKFWPASSSGPPCRRSKSSVFRLLGSDLLGMIVPPRSKCIQAWAECGIVLRPQSVAERGTRRPSAVRVGPLFPRRGYVPGS